MVAGHETLLMTERRAKDAMVRVVCAISQELQSQEGMCGAALAEIDFNRIGLPFVLFPHRDKVDGETPDHAFARQTRADFRCFAHDCTRVRRIGREATPEI